MLVKTGKYRLSLYETFACLAKAKGLQWVVAHGSEGYPETIGRDLDILCDGIDNINLAINLFKDVANKQSETKWIIEPHPIWGRRILAISENFEVAELHILYKLNSGLLDCQIDWNKVNDELFPHNDDVTYFKSKLMPLLGGSAKLERYTKNDVETFPWSVKRLYKKNVAKQPISAIDKLLVYFQLGGFNLKRMYYNYRYSKQQTAGVPLAKTVPIVLIKREQLKDIEDNLNEIFLKFVCGDQLDRKDINYHQSRQRLVYLTTTRGDVQLDITLTNENEVDCLEKLVDALYLYNARRSEEYTRYYDSRIIK